MLQIVIEFGFAFTREIPEVHRAIVKHASSADTKAELQPHVTTALMEHFKSPSYDMNETPSILKEVADNVGLPPLFMDKLYANKDAFTIAMAIVESTFNEV